MKTKTTNLNRNFLLAAFKKFLGAKSFLVPFVIIIYSLYLGGCESSKGQDNASAIVMSVPVANPIQKEITEWDEYMGRFKAVERVEVRARVSGYIDAVKFKDGDIVEKGDVLFVIDQRPFLISLKQAEAQLAQAQAEQEQARSAFDRVKALNGSRAISQEEYDQREQALYVAAARVEAAQANVNRSKLDLEFTVVRAPVSGKVSEDFVNAGNLISGGTDQATLLTTIVSLDPIYFYFEGSEAALLKYSRNGNSAPEKVVARLMDENEYLHEGKIDFIDNVVDPGTGTFQGRAIFPNPNHIIEPGMFANVKVMHSSLHNAILIPDAAITSDQSRKIILVVSDSNKVQAKPVQLGPLHSRDLRIVRSGISADDLIVIGNIQKIRPGLTVRPEKRDLNHNLITERR